MKRLLVIFSLMLILTACGASNQPVESMTANNTQSVEENHGGGTSQTPIEEETEVEFKLNKTFQTLLDEVNATHEVITFYNGDYSAYMGQYENPDFDPSVCRHDPDAVLMGSDILTLEQVTADMELYYEALRTNYGGYKYFGGDEMFRPAIDAVIADCAAMDTITAANWIESILRHLSFVKDGHFAVAETHLAECSVPTFFRSISFQKTEAGYVAQNGKIVASVDCYENLDELFKLSLTKDGELVYYPILLEKFPSQQLKRGLVLSNTCLTVRFTDESIQFLYPEPFFLGSYATEDANALVREEDGIPIVTVNQFYPINGGMTFTDSAFRYRDTDILIMDLRTNKGGLPEMVSQWFTDYAQREVWAHSMNLRLGDPNPVYERYFSRIDEEFVPMDNVLVVLTSKLTGSGGDDFVDFAHNLENTIIVGENTAGILAVNQRKWTLPNTGLSVFFGDTLFLHPEEYFEEYRGYLPDIWVPAAEAEEAVMNFIAKNTTAN
mgnify:CR=1 FL=1